MINMKRQITNFKFGNRKNNNFTLDKNNIEAGVLSLSSAVTDFVIRQKRAKRHTAWSKISSILISGAWVCILTGKDMTSGEKDYVLNQLRENNLVFENKTYDWGEKGYRKDFKSSYLALGPWSKHRQLRNVKNSYGLLTITLPKK